MIFITSVIFILIKFFGLITVSWEVIILFLFAFAAVALSISLNSANFIRQSTSINYLLPLEERLNDLEEKLDELIDKDSRPARPWECDN